MSFCRAFTCLLVNLSSQPRAILAINSMIVIVLKGFQATTKRALMPCEVLIMPIKTHSNSLCSSSTPLITKSALKLKAFVLALQSKSISLENKDFRDFDVGILDKQSLVYIDPPYLLATASYNENGAWSKDDEQDLYEFMQELHSKGVKFAFSNVLFHKVKEHKVLKSWLEKNQNFHTHFLDFSYKNCNYRTKKKPSSEVLITNYRA